jgi:hypothetical protein
VALAIEPDQPREVTEDADRIMLLRLDRPLHDEPYARFVEQAVDLAETVQPPRRSRIPLRRPHVNSQDRSG